MKSRTSDEFWKHYSVLPLEIKKQAKKAYILFQADPYHSSLHFKRAHSTRPIFSTRITKDYRALGVQEGNEIIWFWIGSHAGYNHLLKKR